MIMKIAIVHDWLYGGGAEKVVEALHKIYPEAPIYTAFATDDWRKRLNGRVVTGYLGRWPFNRMHRFLPLLHQWWFKSLDLSEYDLVISSSGNGGAKFVSIKKPAIHINYCHSPTHFYWRKYDEYLDNPSIRPKWLARLGMKILVKRLKSNDYRAAQKVGYFIANSNHIAADIKKHYGRDSEVIHPPIDISRFMPMQSGMGSQTYIIWGRHVPYKRGDLAIEACNQLGRRLIVVSDGPFMKRMQALAGDKTEFSGWITDEEFNSYVKQSAAFLFPGEEDFGISPVEALAAGLPVIAYARGGALDYVVDAETGVLFDEQTVGSLAAAIQRFESMKFDEAAIKKFVRTEFAPEIFDRKIKAFVDRVS